jgi:hypothetical protein
MQTLTGQVADTPAIREFLDRVLEKTSREECRAIAEECALKSAAVQAALPPGGTVELDQQRWLLRSVFATHRRIDPVLAAAESAGGLGTMLDALCWGGGPPNARVDRFVDGLSSLGDAELATELAGEALHHTQPAVYWLCSRWMWSPAHRTGSLALVTTGADLSGTTPGETYVKVGTALLMVRASAEAAGLLDLGRAPWNLDVLLASVYCVYAYTVTRLRMTQEFNKVIPPLPNLARRLLGLHRLEMPDER